MNYKFTKTDEGVMTDKKVQTAVAKLDKLEGKGTLTIEAGYKGANDAYCKMSGAGLKEPIEANNLKVGEAVGDAVKKASQIIRNTNKTKLAKIEHARAKDKKNPKGSQE